MSFVIRVKNADFSSIGSAVVTDSTANTSGLQSFFRLKSNTAYAQTNLAYKGNATVVGSPTLTSLHASVTGTNYFQFNTKPTDASRTIAIVVRGFSAPTAVHPAGSWAGSPTTVSLEAPGPAGPTKEDLEWMAAARLQIVDNIADSDPIAPT